VRHAPRGTHPLLPPCGWPGLARRRAQWWRAAYGKRSYGIIMVRPGSTQVLLLGWRGQEPRASERRSRWSAVAGTSGPGYQAHILSAGRPTTAGTGARCQCAVADCPGSPPAAGRAWVPGCRARARRPV